MVERWLGWHGLGAVLLASACGPGTPDEDDDDDDDDAEMHYDYGACDSVVRPPTCDGLDCAEDPEARADLQMLLGIVADRGYADAFTPKSAEYLPATNQLLVDYQLQVGWMRVWSFINMKVPETDAELRAALEAHVDAWAVPESLADPEVIVAAVEGCDARLEVDPCESFWDDFMVHASHEEELPGCVIQSTRALVDPRTGEVTQCIVDETYGCEDDG